MLRTRIYSYFTSLEKRAVYFIGLFLSMPLVLVAFNSMPQKMKLDQAMMIAIAVWSLVFFIKPIRRWVFNGLYLVGAVWLSAGATLFSSPIKDGLNSLFPGGVNLSYFIYDRLKGAFVWDGLVWVKNFLMEKSQADDAFYYNAFMALVALVLIAIVNKLIEKRVNWKVFLLIGLYFIIAWFIYVSRLQFYFSVYFVGITVYKQFGIYENLITEAGERGERTRYYNYNSAVTVGTIIMVFVLAFANIGTRLLPMAEINVKLDQTFPSVGSLRTDFLSGGRSNTFSFSNTMYAPNGKMLGGPILDRDYSVVFRVRAEEGGLYLRGRTKNIYTGNEWQSDYNTYRNNVFVGDLHTALPKEQLSEITIYPEHIKTRTLFSPYLFYISSYERREVYGNNDRIVYVKEGLDTEYKPYNVHYVKDDYVYLYDFLNDDDRENYLQLPKDGLERTEDLTRAIISGITDPKEKIKAIETYLRENYRYSLYTVEPDYSKDFVERFLFEEEVGYCTYFATSLAVMGRFADVPTRYVEGYLTSDFLDADGLYEVTANRAHAWVEAYIEGEGWVRFEPTPAYSPVTPSDSEPDVDDFALNSDVDREDEDIVPSDTQDQPDQTAGKDKGFIIPVDLMLQVATYLLVTALIAYIVYRKRKRVKDDIELGTTTEKINRRINYMMSMARLVNDEFNPAELPKDVLHRICEFYLMLELPSDIAVMIDQSLYSLHEFDEEEFNQFENFFVDFEESVKKKITKVGHFAHKYIFNTLYHRDYYM